MTLAVVSAWTRKCATSSDSVQARFPSDHVQIEGRAHEYVRIGDEGGRATFRFCPICGATVYFEIDAMPGVIAVPVGAFADRTFPPPRVSVYGVRRHPWTAMPQLHAEELDWSALAQALGGYMKLRV